MYATQTLRDEHEAILIMLDVLEHLAQAIGAGRPVALEDAARALDFLRTFADACHHGKEEDLLFPALEQAGLPAAGGPVGVMLLEHTQGRAYIRGMGEALARLQAGEPAGRDFAVNALGYVTLLRAHIDKENHVLFQMAERLLSPEVHARLATAFETVERKKIGEGVHAQYHALVEELAGRYLQRAA